MPPTGQGRKAGRHHGQSRPYGTLGDCCLPAPSVMGVRCETENCCAPGAARPADKCKIEEGCVWPATEHGIFVDHNGFVYLGGNSANSDRTARPGRRPTAGGDLKFPTKDGKF